MPSATIEERRTSVKRKVCVKRITRSEGIVGGCSSRSRGGKCWIRMVSANINGASRGKVNKVARFKSDLLKAEVWIA